LTEALNNNFEAVKQLFLKNYGTDGVENKEYGVAVRINNYLDKLLDPTNGYFKTNSSGISSETKNIEDSIQRYNMRLELKEKSLRRQYTLLEKAMSSADMQSAWLSSQLL